MITANDLGRSAVVEEERSEPLPVAEEFDLEDSEIDRRLFYEITGRQLIANEFNDEDTSDDDWENLNAPDPLEHAFNYAPGPDSGDDDGR